LPSFYVFFKLITTGIAPIIFFLRGVSFGSTLLSHPHKRFPYLKGKGYICYKKKGMGVVVKESLVAGANKRNRGVFADCSYERGDIVERCPVIVLPDADYERIVNTELGYYVFAFDGGGSCIVLGYGSLPFLFS